MTRYIPVRWSKVKRLKGKKVKRSKGGKVSRVEHFRYRLVKYLISASYSGIIELLTPEDLARVEAIDKKLAAMTDEERMASFWAAMANERMPIV